MAVMTDDAREAPFHATFNLQTRISNVRFGGRDLRIIRPSHPAPGIALRALPELLHIEADQTGLEQLMAAWSLAVFSPRSIIYLPIRQNPGRVRATKLDLVFLHSSLQFKLSRWKELKSRLGTGRLHTAEPVLPVLPTHPDPERWTRRQSRNGVVFDSSAQTLFVVGTRDGFRVTAHVAGRLQTDPAACFDAKFRHSCVMLRAGRHRSGTGRHGTPGVLHAELNPAQA